MLVYDELTDSRRMVNAGIVQSIAKTTQAPAEGVFKRLARHAAKRTSQLLGARVEHTGQALTVLEEYIPGDVVLKHFRREFLQVAKVEAGIQ